MCDLEEAIIFDYKFRSEMYACFFFVWGYGMVSFWFGSCYHSPRTVNISVATIILISTEPEKRKNREYGQRKIKNELKQ